MPEQASFNSEALPPLLLIFASTEPRPEESKNVMTVTISLLLQSVVGVSGERPTSASEVNQYLICCTLVCLLDAFGSIQRRSSTRPSEQWLYRNPWDYLFSAFVNRSKLFFLPAIASATKKNLIAHPLFEGRLGSYSLPLQIPVRPEESKSVMTVTISLVLQSVRAIATSD